MRLNVPVIFVSVLMEAGKTKLSDQLIKLDLVDAMVGLLTTKLAMLIPTKLSAQPALPAAHVQGCSPRTP